MQLPLIEIRDQRQKEWFWVDNEFLNGTAKLVGPVAALVYIALCRHSSNDTQTCFPSMETLAEEVGIKSRNTIAKGIKALERQGIIQIERKRNSVTGHSENNVYYLLSRKYWKTAKQEQFSNEKKVETTLPLIKTEIELPAWLNKTAWEAWVLYRKEKDRGKKMTPSTIKMQIKFLSEHKHDHIEIIRNSIMKGWTGLFPIKKDKPQYYGGSRMSDKARAYEKRVQKEQEDREFDENAKHNAMLVEIKKMTENLKSNFSMK